MKRIPRGGRNQMSYYGQCPDNEMPPHMQRGPCFPDGYGKMDGPCGMGVSEFKSPMMANADPPPPPAKKKRRTSNTMAAANQASQPSVMQDLLPPPLTGYGDTIVASNPFDDTPPSTPSMSHMNPMNHVNKHMSVGPCMSPAAPMMGSMSPCHIVGSPMNCGPPVGSPINCGPPMGNCSPMSGGGNNPNCGPIGSPHTVCNNRQVSRSPLVCPPMSNAGPVMNCGPSNNNPMNVTSVHPMNRSPSSLGSPLSSVMASNVRGNSPLDCGLGLSSVGSQKGSPMSVMGSHNMNNLNCGSPMGSPSNVSLSNCNNGSMNMGSPITSPLGNVPCSMSGGNDMGMNLNGVMSRSPMNVAPNSVGSPMLCGSSMRGQSPISGGPLGMGRDNCGPSHISVKPNTGPMPPGSCGMPMNNPCSRPSDMNNMQCGPNMNSSHCNQMMNNPPCGPGMNNLPCIGNNMNRPQCGNPMGMGNPFDGMNPQCRPNMNRSQYPRPMNNMHYGGPNNMNNLCGPPPDMGNMQCGPNPNMHCNDSNMNNPQCVSNNMNQCSGGNMFNSPFSPFDSRCSPNLPFSTNDVGMNNGFYRNMNHTTNAPCIPNMRNPCSVSSANELPNTGDMSIKTENRDHDLNAELTNNVCGIPNDTGDELNLMACSDGFLRDKRLDGEDRKPKDCNGGLALEDDDKLDDMKKIDSDKKDGIKIKDEKLDTSKEDENCKNISPNSNVGSTSTVTTNTTNTSCSTANGTVTCTTSASVTNDHNVEAANECKNEPEDDIFKDGNSSGNGIDNEDNADGDKKDDEKLHSDNDNSFGDDKGDKSRDKNSKSDEVNTSGDGENIENERNKENGNGTPIKIENDEFFDKNKTDCVGRPPNSFNNGNVLSTNNFGAGNDVSNVLNANSSPYMNESMCTTSIMPNMNRATMSNAMNHSMNYPNSRPIAKVYPINKSKVFNPQNPNAPPIYVCGECHKEVNDNEQVVLCESGCDFFYHRACSGLSEHAFQLLTEEVYAEWVCDKCLSTKNVELVKFKP